VAHVAVARRRRGPQAVLEHSLRVTTLAERLADAYGGALAVDADLVAAACLLCGA
jgi:HD superfamily phosphodiesterase